MAEFGKKIVGKIKSIAGDENTLYKGIKDKANDFLRSLIGETNYSSVESIQDRQEIIMMGLDRVKKFINEDDKNFIGMIIRGKNYMINGDVPFCRATELCIELIYAGNICCLFWKEEEYHKYDEYRAVFHMEEREKDKIFWTKVWLGFGNSTAALNAALEKAGFDKKVPAEYKSIFISFL